jgi:hypothetical protein
MAANSVSSMLARRGLPTTRQSGRTLEQRAEDPHANCDGLSDGRRAAVRYNFIDGYWNHLFEGLKVLGTITLDLTSKLKSVAMSCSEEGREFSRTSTTFTLGNLAPQEYRDCASRTARYLTHWKIPLRMSLSSDVFAFTSAHTHCSDDSKNTSSSSPERTKYSICPTIPASIKLSSLGLVATYSFRRR